jgi:hypothetical protein
MAKLGRFSAIHRPAEKIIHRRLITSISSLLYSFTSWTFTNGNSTQQFGPTIANLRALYDTTSNTWINNDSYFTAVNGIQYWTVPATGTYTITAAGASGGGNVARGAQLTTIASLTQGEVIRIAVGQRGGNVNVFYGTGGGGSYVVRSPFNSNASIILIAGGAGGISRTGGVANSATSGGQATTVPGVTTGLRANGGGGGGGYISNGGFNGANGTDQGAGGYAGGGGGFFGNGGGSGGVAVGGRSWTFGSNGGVIASGTVTGSFGGGGGPNARGGGGGGYNGGNAGDNSTYDGAGGSSYIAGNIVYAASNVNLGNGFVTITAGGTVTNTLSTNVAFTYGTTIGTSAGSPFATTVNSYTIASQPASNPFNYFSVPGGSGYAMGTGDYTIEWFQYMTASATNMRIFWYGTGPSWGMSIEGADATKTAYHWPGAASLGTFALTQNTWQHFALVRISGRLYFYFNGNCTNPGGAVNSTNITDITSTLSFATRTNSTLQNEHFVGSMTNIRIVKGLGVYTGNFTVPTSPLATIAGTNPYGGANTTAITSGLTSLLLNP